jgi:hypothetical protein
MDSIYIISGIIVLLFIIFLISLRSSSEGHITVWKNRKDGFTGKKVKKL